MTEKKQVFNEPAWRDRKTLIVMPTYNEIENIQQMLEAIHAVVPHVHVLIVDDSSPDGTASVVQARMRYDRHVHLLSREGKGGLASAYLAGFQWGLARDYERILEMDADFSHDPSYLPAMLQAAEEADVVVGSRNVAGGGTEGWPWYRHALSRAGSLYARGILGVPVRDVTAGFICYRRSALERLELKSVRAHGYVFQVEMKYLAHRAGLRIQEVPIVFRDRTLGASKMSGAIAREALIGIPTLRGREWWNQRSRAKK